MLSRENFANPNNLAGSWIGGVGTRMRTSTTRLCLKAAQSTHSHSLSLPTSSGSTLNFFCFLFDLDSSQIKV